ncbi:MAG: hypothetical protein IT534_11495 [Bauldia sp.]|nr:hypothetical protein [Bauldia sp.]
MSETGAHREALAGSLTLAGIAMIAGGAVLWLLLRDTLDWAAALFLAWGVAGGFICFGNAVVDALHLGRREPVPIPVRVTQRKR